MEKNTDIPTYSKVTADISITVVPQFLERQSIPEQGQYAFAYTVLIQNLGLKTLQLFSRHWFVYSGGDLYTEVKGEGVVGEQPILGPGDAYQYTSGSVIKDPVGAMEGTYTFLDLENTGQEVGVEILIPRFDLICSHYIH